jgi:hypothetical protein
MATVRFLVPDHISCARCDCVQEQGCVHVALALCNPWSPAADRFIVPDIDAVNQATSPDIVSEISSTETSLDRAMWLLSGMVHVGHCARDGATVKRGMELTAALRSEGFIKTADLMSVWLKDSTNDLNAFGGGAA